MEVKYTMAASGRMQYDYKQNKQTGRWRDALTGSWLEVALGWLGAGWKRQLSVGRVGEVYRTNLKGGEAATYVV